eukprot:CAMPEP_0171103228 /NCGR_PEP_ID=MMETSP0766_2-20121228/58803_1 /TAXON_ID=439317 /ORGANISM="Gambierdiscus australes, Strain CAWD 149" /LENGTH=149 /DNA_ID=CAMNT_0011563637 /DNA_START=50 /DNA_END=499 /DNA_ORIENTATION=-
MTTSATLVVASLLMASGVRRSDKHPGPESPQEPSSGTSGDRTWALTPEDEKLCTACSLFWPAFSLGVALESNNAKMAFFDGIKGQQSLQTLEDACLHDLHGDHCTEILVQVSEGPALCWNKTDATKFCGCIVAGSLDYNEPTCPAHFMG